MVKYKNMLNLTFLLSGFIAVISQTILLREMLVVFCGNELSIGIIFSNWLIGVALGSFIVHRLRIINNRLGLIYTFILEGILILVSFYVIRNLRNILNIFSGQGISLFTTVWSSFIILLPLSIIVGAQFVFGVRLLESMNKTGPSARIYVLESLGYLFGGVILTYVFLPNLYSSYIAILLIILCLIAIFFLNTNLAVKKYLEITLLASIVLFSFPAKRLENITLNNLYSGFKILDVENSPYSQLAVLERNEEFYITSDGISMISFPNMDLSESESFANISLLFHPNPKNVLLIGSAGKLIPAILNHKVENIDYVEQDPEYIRLLNKYFPFLLNDKEVKVFYEDGRAFLKRSKQKYDAIIVGVPYPINLSLNRFYTVEFFNSAKKHISDKGIFCLSIPGSLVYLEENLLNLASTIEQSVKTVFPYYKLIPKDESIIIVAGLSPLAGVSEIKKRFQDVKDKTKFISASYIDYVLSEQKEKWLNENLRPAKINRDFVPNGLVHSLTYWQSMFAKVSADIYKFLIKYSWILWIIILGWLVLGKVGYPGVALTSGFGVMGLQMLSIWGLQIYSGHIYHLIGLITAVFMAGSSLGAGITRKEYFRDISNKVLIKLEIAFCLWVILWWIFIKLNLMLWPMFFIFSFGSGLILGMEFPLITVSDAIIRSKGESFVVGNIYTADLLGAWLASIILGTIIIPAWGFEKSMFFIFAVKLISLKWILGDVVKKSRY